MTAAPLAELKRLRALGLAQPGAWVVRCVGCTAVVLPAPSEQWPVLCGVCWAAHIKRTLAARASFHAAAERGYAAA